MYTIINKFYSILQDVLAIKLTYVLLSLTNLVSIFQFLCQVHPFSIDSDNRKKLFQFIF